MPSIAVSIVASSRLSLLVAVAEISLYRIIKLIPNTRKMMTTVMVVTPSANNVDTLLVCCDSSMPGGNTKRAASIPV